jgi:hypothetical protein
MHEENGTVTNATKEPPMPRITRDSLLTLEAYALERKDFRARVLAHKKHRSVHLGDHVTLLFEDELTIRYQIQEMLRIEKTFEEAGIQDELDAYNPLVPDGSNFKATMLIEYRVWIEVEGCGRVHAIADEDLERENEQKTSSVHFLRFELTAEMVAALKYGVALGMGIDHPNYSASIPAVSAAIRTALVADLA